MSAKLRKLLIAVPITLFFTVVSFAQTTSISGSVKGEDGKPATGVVIKIERKDVKQNLSTKTDKKGNYVYAGLQPGVYKVIVQFNGQDRDMMDNVDTHREDPTVNFDLARTAKAAAAAKAPAAGALPPDAARDMSPKERADYEKKLKDSAAQMAKNKDLNDAFNAGKDAVTAKNWDAAIENFTKASQIDPAQHVVWANLAEAEVQLSKTKSGADKQAAIDKGIAAYQKALEIKPDDASYHNNYALGLAQNGKFADAQAELTKAAQLDPTQAGQFYYNLGAVEANTGQYDPAMEAFRKAIEINPDYAEAHYQYGLCLIGKATTSADGKLVAPPGTAEEFQKYLQLAPAGPNAEAAKAMIGSLGSSIETNFSKPGAKPAAPTKKK